MPGMCSVPGCKGYKKARSRGVVFHSLPTRDPGRCRKWLKAIQNPKFDENTPVRKYGNIRVCSQHFKPEDYEPDIQAEVMKTTPRKILKSGVVPTVFSGRQQADLRTSMPADDRGRTEGQSTSSQAFFLGVEGTGVDSASSPALPITIASRAASIPSQPPLPAELGGSLCRVASVDRPKESFHQDTELSSTVTSKSDDNTEKDLNQSRTIVNDRCLMELFKKCQTCGQPITKNKVSRCGAQTKVKWSCLGGHRGIWMSSPHLWEAFPEIHFLITLSVLFSGGTFTHFKKWAKHLHLNFMGHKTFFEIQKAYLNPEMKRMNRTEQVQIFAKNVHKPPEGILHISDPLKKMKAKSRRREKEALVSSYEKRSPILVSTKMCLREPTAQSSLGRLSTSEKGKWKHEHWSKTTPMASEVDCLQDSFEEMEVTIEDDECNRVKNRLSDLTSDMENVEEITELSAPRAADSCDEDVYVPIIPQRSKISELLLECEEEELEPWQKHTLHVRLKEEIDVEEEDVRELNDDQTDCKPDPSSLQNWSAGQHTLKPEADGFVHTSEVHQISDNPVSLSSVQSPVVYATSSNQLQSEQSNSQTLSALLSVPCFAEVKLKSTGTSDKPNT
ncbi:uncharacterized protein LOC116688243 [Etheostoma spectabile]|uniref:uncharacterized protein LOC116688243 n=1 Tax=Etheostoma spectabile TaxID=54343 RepID=UPI0013AED1C9|nr:uncharacterized protein LOC116688243 [Etheostoma spectabile]